MSTETALVSTADSELFESAMATEPAQATAPENVDQPLLDNAGAPRDEKGRFAAANPAADEQKAEETPRAEKAEDQEQKPAERKEPPEFRFREVSEAKRMAEEKAAALEAQNRQLLSMLQQFNQQPQQRTPAQQPPEALDPVDALLTDPEKWAKQQLDPVAEQVRQTREFYSRRLAEQAHGADKVQAAYTALDAAISSGQLSRDAVLADLSKSMDPYGDIMNWHSEQVTRQKVGNDPDAFFSRTLEERLSDPAFAAQLVEKLTGQARQQPQGGNGRPAIDIPPSLSRMTSAAPAVVAAGDMTDASIFDNALR